MEYSKNTKEELLNIIKELKEEIKIKNEEYNDLKCNKFDLESLLFRLKINNLLSEELKSFIKEHIKFYG